MKHGIFIEMLDVVVLKNGKQVTILEVYNDKDFLVEDNKEEEIFDVTIDEIKEVVWKSSTHKAVA